MVHVYATFADLRVGDRFRFCRLTAGRPIASSPIVYTKRSRRTCTAGAGYFAVPGSAIVRLTDAYGLGSLEVSDRVA